jgi:hypothetical protein
MYNNHFFNLKRLLYNFPFPALAPNTLLSLFAMTHKFDMNTTQYKQCCGKLKHRFSFSESFSTLCGMTSVRVGDKYATLTHAGLFFGTHKLCFFSPCQNVCDPLVHFINASSSNQCIFQPISGLRPMSFLHLTL